MPQPDTKVESMGSKTIPGVFIGYHVHAGGLWSGDYLVADFAPFRRDCNVAKSKVKIHRIRGIAPNRKGEFIFLVANLRHKRMMALGDDFNAPTDDEMPVLTATSDDEADGPDTDADEPSGSYKLLFGPADPRIDADAVPPPHHELGSPPTDPSPLQGGWVPAGDTRGLGLESSPRRGKVRKYTGSTRPPTIPSELWQKSSAKTKTKAIAEYKAELAAAAASSSAAPAIFLTLFLGSL